MTTAPGVSVILPTFNRPEMLAEALASLAGQTFGDFEVLVVNDGGRDVTEVLERFSGLRVRQLRHEANRGLSAARNTGLAAATGRYVAFLDDDDLLYSHHLETLVAHMQADPACQVAYTDSLQAVQACVDGAWVVERQFLAHSIAFDRRRLLLDNHLAVQCVLMRREVATAIGPFDTSLPVYEDWDFWLRAARSHPFHHLPVVTSEYRVRPSADRLSVRRRDQFLRTRFVIWGRHGWLPAVLAHAACHVASRRLRRWLAPGGEARPSDAS